MPELSIEQICDQWLAPLKDRYYHRPTETVFSYVITFFQTLCDKSLQAYQKLIQSLERALYLADLMYRWDPSGGLIFGLTVGTIILSTPVVLVLIILATTVAITLRLCAASSLLLKNLCHELHQKVRHFLGHNIDSTFEQDKRNLSCFMQRLSQQSAPLWREPKTLQQARTRYKEFSVHLHQKVDVTSLETHLHFLQEALNEMQRKSQKQLLATLLEQVKKNLQKPRFIYREDWLQRYAHYSFYLTDYQTECFIAHIEGRPLPSLTFLRDITAKEIFSMPARCTTWTAQISWQQALTLLLEQECRHYHGAIVAQSPAFQSWIWWVRDRFNGLDTALPAECLECPYLSDFKIALWDNLSAPEPQPLLLRKSEFFMNIDLLAGEHDASSQPFNSLGQ